MNPDRSFGPGEHTKLERRASWRVRRLCLAMLVSSVGFSHAVYPATQESPASEGKQIVRKAVVSRFSSRPDFFDTKLSPGGTRLATIARLSGNVTTLVVWDVTSDQPEPLFRVGVPRLVSVREYGWVNEDNLVAWLVARDPNAGTSRSGGSSDSSDSSGSSQLSQTLEGDQVTPETYTYVAHIDVARRKVTPRQSLTQPTETALVRAPMSDGRSVLLAECFGRFITEVRELVFMSDLSSSGSPSSGSSSGESSSGGSSSGSSSSGSSSSESSSSDSSSSGSTSSSSSSSSDDGSSFQTSQTTDRCILKTWAPGGAATKAAPAVYGNLMTYFGDYQADQARSQGRRRNGDVFAGSWTADQKDWEEHILADGEILPRLNESAELDDPELWDELHALMPVAGEPAGRVVMTSNSQTPVAVQVTRPGRRLIILDQAVADIVKSIISAFPDQIVDLLSVSENRDTVLFSVSDRIDPGGYYLWRRNDGVAIPLLPRYKELPERLVGTSLETGWTSADTLVGVTRPPAGTKLKGIVIMPALVSDEAAFAAFSEFDMEVQWLVANGLTVVQVPVGAPGSLAPEERGEAWRKSVAARLNLVLDRARRDTTHTADGTLCLYGRELAGYAALAASEYGSGISCVVAVNTALEPDLVLEPYKRVRSINGITYLGRSHESIAAWRAVFGEDREAAAPGNWRFNDFSQVLLVYQMYDPGIRPLSMQTGEIRSAINRAGGDIDVYDARTYTGNVDYWNSRMYLEIAEFLAPPEKPKTDEREGIVTIYDIEPDDSE